jgi:hypothetical protein
MRLVAARPVVSGGRIQLDRTVRDRGIGPMPSRAMSIKARCRVVPMKRLISRSL